jgi:hypothetical protein
MKIAGPESMAANLTSFVSTINSLGAHPILLTALSRRNYGSDGKIQDTLQPWADATEQVGKETNTPVLPLHAASIAYLERIGNQAGVLLNRAVSQFALPLRETAVMQSKAY